MSADATILYTLTDEAPFLATHSLLPIVQAFTHGTGVEVETRDISLAARILAAFSDLLPADQRVPDTLAELGELALEPTANIVKLPNISASVPQLEAAVAELKALGFALPDYPEEPETDEERSIQARYDKVKGSAVNPVLRQGNSDRRAPRAVKEYAKNHPHPMGTWSADCKTHVATMSAGDFRHNELSVTIPQATTARIEHVRADGTAIALKEGLQLQAGEVLDGTFISREALYTFLESQVADAKAEGLLFSLHMKATMMKVSDPIIFGHAVRVFFAGVFEKHTALFHELGVEPNNGFADLLSRIAELPDAQRSAIEADVEAAYEAGPDLAMVHSDKGITNLHVPSDVIIDASMPAMIRTSGCMWNAAGETQETKAVIPDSSYAGVYQVVIDDCRTNGAFDPRTMGSVSNVGLMAQKAEEYGSHDKTFEIGAPGRVRVVDDEGTVLMSHEVQAGDIWRACQVKNAPIRDWVRLALGRARATGAPVVFWLDEARPHDAQLLEEVRPLLEQEETEGLQIHVLSPVEATRFSVAEVRAGRDVISATGNVLRDYLTDLFPILEVGTSAKMLSIVPLMAGGGLFETGAGGSAPKHVQQMVAEGHLRWDSLGEFLALAVSFQHLGEQLDNAAARILGETLDDATTRYLLENRSPSRKVNQIDNRGSHYWLGRYWAEALAAQTTDPALAARFAPVAEALATSEASILRELLEAQGEPVDLGGYYRPDAAKVNAAMRPSATLNGIVEGL